MMKPKLDPKILARLTVLILKHSENLYTYLFIEIITRVARDNIIFLNLKANIFLRYTVNLHNKVTICGYQLHLGLIYFN